MEENTKINEFFKNLGLSDHEVEIYLTLLKFNELTVLGLSKQTGIERTKLYRLSESMLQTGLIYERVEYKKRYFRASSIEVIEQLVQENLSKAEDIKKNLQNVIQELNIFKQKNSPTNVKYYYGVSGIKQVLWNELKAEKEIFAFSYRNLQEIVGSKFFYLWEKELENRNITMNDLRSKEFIESSKNFKPMPFKTDIIRYIDHKILNIETEIDTYNNTVVIFNWFKGDVFAVEIENDKLASMHKQMFKTFWNLAKPIK